MDKLFNCLDPNAKEDECKEYLSILVNHPIDKLELSCLISPKLRKTGYAITPRLNCKDTAFQWEVLDASQQSMWNYQKQLEYEKITPHASKEGVRWIIYHPKIGYKYKMYFSLSKSN